MDQSRARLGGELLAQAGVRERPIVAHVRAEDRVVVLGEDLDQPCSSGGVVEPQRLDRRGGPAGVADAAQRDDTRRQASGQLREDALGIGPRPVDLVDEDQGRDVQPLQGAEEERRLGLDTLDRGDDEDGTVEDAEDALDLRDEVGVARRIDEVDGQVAEPERGHGRADRDPALAFELERVGLGGAGVDAADVVDRAGREEQPLGESGLTRVDVGEHAEIERTHGASCLPRRS
jgi:hypothetical protein